MRKDDIAEHGGPSSQKKQWLSNPVHDPRAMTADPLAPPGERDSLPAAGREDACRLEEYLMTNEDVIP